MSRPGLLAIGGAHIDRRGIVAGAYVPGASNPGHMREEVGGGAFNALRAAVRRGASGTLLSLRGGDAAGSAVAEATARAGIADLSAVFLDRATPSYTALLDAQGELIAGLADMGLYEIGFPRQIVRRKIREAIAAADGVLCDANLPAPALEKLAVMAGNKPIFAIAVSPAKVVRFGGALPGLACLFMNRREAWAVTGEGSGADVRETIAALRRLGLKSGVITAGPEPVTAFDADGVFEIETPSLSRVADVTGAGDALAGATCAALLGRRGLREAVREGVAAAALAVASEAAAPEFTMEAFEATLALVGEPRGVA